MAWRALRRTPGFTFVAVLLLAIGIGGATVIFSVTDAVLLRRLAVPRPGELVRPIEMIPGRPQPAPTFDWETYQEFQPRTRSFARVSAHNEFDVTREDGDESRRTRADLVAADYFDVLQVHAALGHLPVREDEVGLSYRLWESAFHADPRVPGRVLRLNGHPFTVAGVLPRGFNGMALESGPQLFLHQSSAKYFFKEGAPHRCCVWEIVGRLRPGLTASTAEAETSEALHAALIASYPRNMPPTAEAIQGVRNQRFKLQSLERGVSLLRDRFGTGLTALFGGAVLLLQLACANIAGMMVARAAARERETAVRTALGATRARLVRHWLAESGLLAAMGGAAGLALTAAALPAVAGRMPPLRDLGTALLPVWLDVRLNWRVFAFAFAVCALTALLAGIAPAWHASRASLVDGLKSQASDPRRTRLRAVLTIVQVAICTVVLANSALLVATLHALRSAPAGFDRDRVVTFTIAGNEIAGATVLRLEREARNVPGVQLASLASRSLMRGSGFKQPVGLPGTRNGRDLNASANSVSPAYFETMGIRILQGRGFAPGDGDGRKPKPVVVNQVFAQRFFPNTNPIGRQYGIGFDRAVTAEFEIVGVVTDTRYRSLREPFQPITYSCFCDAAAQGQGEFQLEVRTFARPETVIASIRTLMRRIDPRLVPQEVRTLAQDVDDSLWAERTLAALGSAFAAVAALVACIGLYGLLSYTLAQRRREIGIRMALGAGPRDIARATLLRVLALVAVGAACGTAVALWTGRMLSAILWEIAPADVRVHIAAWVLMLLTASAAAALPAWRATRIDPAKTLREN